ncbi:hypothetical protein QSJ18_03790 [Gordonia sp. ABSL1-1]|uniref:hypothetical protein n=1 Tax=Gordonia sp. ABSL1-1 TaxID=3053923 RepID=UPI002573E589|nr:hypothetical protein [Gordonia sp. ABSL1-1]MDL9935860.1 hypothetical protein [Gordonia sp. ABSL1-1]
MIVTGIVLLALTAILPPVVEVARRRQPLRRHPVLVDAATTTAMVALVLLAALLAIPDASVTDGTRVICYIVTVPAAVVAGGPIVRTVLAAGGAVTRHDDASGIDQSPAPPFGPLRGGRVIGYLERLAVAAALLAGWPEGLAVVLAVKSLARFPELRAPHASEQFIMGTFASVLWAVGVVGVGVLLIT